MSTLERIKALGIEGLEAVTERDGTPTVRIPASSARALLEGLAGACGFECPTLVTGMDHHPRTPRYEVLWQFLSMAHGDRILVRCLLEGEDPTVPTCIDLWPGAAFMERECYDMFGIRFEGHEDLRRLLMPEGYGHFPLRKEFPHQGIEPDRLYREWERRRLERARAAEEAAQ